MRLTFVQLSRFAARWSQLRLTDEDLRALEQLLLRNPDAGAVVAGTGGLRKVRFAPPSRHIGKSGAFRIGYAYFRTVDASLSVGDLSKKRAGQSYISRKN
jgi:hypothetical protein